MERTEPRNRIQQRRTSTYRVAIRSSEPGNNFCSCPDFATNTLGTCKHLEFTLARLGRNRTGRRAFAQGFAPPFSEVYLHYGAQRQVRFRPRAGALATLTRLAAQCFGGGGTLRPEAFARFETFLSAAARLDPDFRCYEDALGFVAQVRDAERRAKALAEAFPRGIRSAAFKNLLRALRRPRGSLPHRRRHGAVDQHRLGPTFRFLHDHQVLDEFGKVVGYRNLDRIGQTLAPVLIRRRKEDVLRQLPKRLEKRFFVPMTPQQMAHHEENREIVGRLVAKWRRFRFLSEADQRRLLIALQNMRMACDSTYLLDQHTDYGVKAGELVTLLDEIIASARHGPCRS